MYLQAPGAVMEARDATTGQLIWEQKRVVQFIRRVSAQGLLFR